MQDIHRIVVPIDKSDSARVATDRAAQLAELFKVDVEIVYVNDSQQFVASAALEDRLNIENQRVLNEFKQIAESRNVNAKTTLLSGASPAEEIVKFVNEHDMIVMASHNKRGFDRFILGSVSEEVLRRCPCAVMIIKPQIVVEHNHTPL